MVDVHTPSQRSFNMSRIRGKDTKPELIVRSIVHQMGCRFRLHRKDLPGTPDLVLPGRSKVIFVHGCFWHMHRCRYGRVKPMTNAAFWQAKREGTVDRDRRNRKSLRAAGWEVFTVWECWTRETEERLIPRLNAFLRD
jgi:DNA mismatch endonuclease, patch repair protein